MRKFLSLLSDESFFYATSSRIVSFWKSGKCLTLRSSIRLSFDEERSNHALARLSSQLPSSSSNGFHHDEREKFSFFIRADEKQLETLWLFSSAWNFPTIRDGAKEVRRELWWKKKFLSVNKIYERDTFLFYADILFIKLFLWTSRVSRRRLYKNRWTMIKMLGDVKCPPATMLYVFSIFKIHQFLHFQKSGREKCFKLFSQY